MNEDEMKCPYCGAEVKIASVVSRNLQAYGGSTVARTSCCGKTIRVVAVITLHYHKTAQVETDDWGH